MLHVYSHIELPSFLPPPTSPLSVVHHFIAHLFFPSLSSLWLPCHFPLPNLALIPSPLSPSIPFSTKGTENPAEDEDRIKVAVDKNGGSYCITQRWIHKFDVIHGAKGEYQHDGTHGHIIWLGLHTHIYLGLS